MEWGNSLIFCSGLVVLLLVILVARKLWGKSSSSNPSYSRDKVVLHQFHRGHYAPSMSAFAVKLETYLRMVKIPYMNVHEMKTGPKGKAPWIEYNGETICDSSFIIEYLNKKFGMDLNRHLNTAERATARAVQKMVEENTYWAVLLTRWVYNRDSTARTLTKIPWLFVWLIDRRTRRNTYYHGIGRHTPKEVTQILTDDVQALSDILGEKKYMFGDVPTEVDCAVFGQLTQLLWCVPDCDAKHFITENCPNLVEYCERIKNQFWPDWDECTTKGGKVAATK
ncbi:hypothetical protein ACJMK2_002220 [Sinanodonta woodiana]|uniref:Failed axon connections homolog n=1 Tax=Sinanodonta woodiana TaxID=1069815 RepID=A0ABD3XXV7_SINWO